MRICHLVEDEHRARGIVVEDVREEKIVERLAFQDEPLVGGIACNESGEVGCLGPFDGEIDGQFAIK